MAAWKKVLNWDISPIFDSIHDLDEERFFGCYYLPETVNEFLDKIVSSLEEGYGFNHKTILGDPGCGKTTFLYYLKTAIKKRKLDGQLHIEIIHLQRLVSNNDYESIIDDRVLKIFCNYFASNNLQSDYELLTKDTTENKTAINNLKDFIIEKSSKFSKRLIIAIDDVDETPEETVSKSLRHVYSLIESERIPRWLVARSTTLNNYKADFIEFIETKFQQRSVFPIVDLYGIINKRIKHDNPDGENPFIPELCHHILAAHNNDLRVAVCNAIAFLENIKPPSTSKNNPKFAGQYLLKNFTKIMTQIETFPNLYINSISNTVPIEKDVFLILASKNRFESGNLKALEAHYKSIYSNIYNKKYAEQSYLININMDHINESIYFLENNRLLFLHPRLDGFYKLTTKGESFVRFVLENLYTETAKSLASKSSVRKHDVFWSLAEMQPDYDPTTKHLTKE